MRLLDLPRPRWNLDELRQLELEEIEHVPVSFEHVFGGLSRYSLKLKAAKMINGLGTRGKQPLETAAVTMPNKSEK
jgi:hypothetical protein